METAKRVAKQPGPELDKLLNGVNSALEEPERRGVLTRIGDCPRTDHSGTHLLLSRAEHNQA